MNTGTCDVYLRKPLPTDKAALIQAYASSHDLHLPWSHAPTDFDNYLIQPDRYLVCLNKTHVIVGTFNISNIVRGWFQSAYLGYEAFAPHQQNGYMHQGLLLLIDEAFKKLNLHRLEANIQVNNIASIKLVSKAGFNKEGFSPKYLRIGGNEWQDHERWAIVNDSWKEPNP